MEIFSGKYSRDMWAEINKAKTVEDLQNALYLVCCRLQKFETYVASISPNTAMQIDKKPCPYCATFADGGALSNFCSNCGKAFYS